MFADFQNFITFDRCQKPFIYVIEQVEYFREEVSEIQVMKKDMENLNKSVN